MKRIVTIGLLILFLFNIIGYYGVYLVLRAKANNGLIEKLDANNFNEEETITLKVPLALPYASDWSGFQRVDGEFEKDGKFYNLVKQKIERDTLIVIAVRDHAEASLFESLVDFVNSNTDNPVTKKAGKLMESFSKDFLSCQSELTTASIGWTMEPAFIVRDCSISRTPHKVHTPPPRSL